MIVAVTERDHLFLKLAVDLAILTVRDNLLQVLVIEIKRAVRHDVHFDAVKNLHLPGSRSHSLDVGPLAGNVLGGQLPRGKRSL